MQKIKFALMYRDMWQSVGKYVPRADQLTEVAPHIVEMGCFDRVETNGGGFEQINLLFGENPNKALRVWTEPFREAGIQCQMLERSLNGIRMQPVPADVRRLMPRVKKAQGTDVVRIFCGMNDYRNIIDSIRYTKEAGLIAQGALSITFSELHTVEYYVQLANKIIEGGADEICLKDMAGIGRPVWLGKIVAGIRKKHPNIPVQYHSHSGPGFAMASILEVARAGAEYIDVSMEPLSWGTGHVDLLAVQAMLKDAGFEVPEVNMKAYMAVRSLHQRFMEDFLGYFINPANRQMNSLLISSGLPGGMMGSLMADLENNLSDLNRWLEKNGKPLLNQDKLLVMLFNEVEHIWPKVGYPPLVTPFSQYVKNMAILNVTQLIKGGDRWEIIPDNVWDMLTGKLGKLPGELAPEITDLAKKEGKEFFTGNPQELYPDKLDEFRKEMDDNGWDHGKDDEELFELAMHPEQYRNYKSGAAKDAFVKELNKRKQEGGGLYKKPVSGTVSEQQAKSQKLPQSLIVDVDGEQFRVTVSYDDKQELRPDKTSAPKKQPDTVQNTNKEHYLEVTSPLSGTFYLTKEPSETPLKPGDAVAKGAVIGYIEAMKTYNTIRSEHTGTVVKIIPENSTQVHEDDPLFIINPA
ncbi:MAG: biotin/lipoyl-containing protein [Bacteroidales bacterium]|nr:biotin/lipoyl-containing protein [Bacteroidales bacterium]